MNVQTATTLFSILAIVCNVTALGLALLWIAARWSPTAAEWRDVVADSLGNWAIVLAWLVALASMLGSLYYSESVGFEPCRLCWYQRIAMYPLAVILGIAALLRDRAVRIYGFALAGIGGAIATYHYLIQLYPNLEAGSCSVTTPCSARYVERFGFVSIPYMALSGFLVILVLLWVWPATSSADAAETASTGE